MEIIGLILLGIIAIILYKIYRQREEEKQTIANQKFDLEYEQEKKEEFKDYPHLIENIDYSWLQLFGRDYIENNFPHLKVAWFLYLQESNNPNLDLKVDQVFTKLWNLSEELLEHLEKYHESSKYEYEIAILTYWQIVAEQTDSFIGKDIEASKKIFQSSPFTDIEKIASWFPKKSNHTVKEISFIDEKGVFPRDSKGSVFVKAKLKKLGI